MKAIDFVIALLLIPVAAAGYADDDIEWRHQAHGREVSLMANPQSRESLAAFYVARGFTAAAIRPYADSCGFSFGMRNGSSMTIVTRLADWRAVGADGKIIAFKLPESWDAEWKKAGVSQAARIAFRWAQFQAENSFAPGDWIMGMATLESVPRSPFQLIARYRDNTGDHDIVLDKLACAD